MCSTKISFTRTSNDLAVTPSDNSQLILALAGPLTAFDSSDDSWLPKILYSLCFCFAIFLYSSSQLSGTLSQFFLLTLHQKIF